MSKINLDSNLLEFPQKDGPSAFWTIRHAVEGCAIFGGIGSGKTSGSGRTLALKYLQAGFGGLVLTAKPDEKELWESYCLEAGRSGDLVIIEPGRENVFNFFEYESAHPRTGRTATENLVEVLKTVIQAGDDKKIGGDDAFWESALDLLLFNTIDLCQLAYGKVTVSLLYDIVQSVPRNRKSESSENSEKTPFERAMDAAFTNVAMQMHRWALGHSEEMKELCQDKEFKAAEAQKAIPDARLLHYVDFFFSHTYNSIGEKTRAIIDFTFSAFLYGLLRDPVHSLFCKGSSTVTPEDCLKGKIILINLPVKIYQKIGRDSQIMFKYIWQRAMERRDVEQNGLPVFLWSDEAQLFLHQQDAIHQATARSSRVATVCLTQNLPNLYASMGGAHNRERVQSYLGTLATKIFHANADVETNKYSSELVGDDFFEDVSQSRNRGKDFTFGTSHSAKLLKVLRPEHFVSLKTGGPLNRHIVQAIIHRQGDPIFDGDNHKQIIFLQKQ